MSYIVNHESILDPFSIEKYYKYKLIKHIYRIPDINQSVFITSF